MLFEVHNTLGPGHHEKYYQKAVAIALAHAGLKFQKELKADLCLYDEKIGNYYLDFLVEDKIVLELKRGGRFYKQDISQVRAYLETKGLLLGILALFANDKLKSERIINWKLVPTEDYS